MAAPVIALESSVLSNPQWFYWEHQFAASNSPTSWSIASGSFHPGMTFDADRGLLFGVATVPGTRNIFLKATNGDGTSAEVRVTVIIGAGAGLPDQDTELRWDIATGALTRADGAVLTAADKTYLLAMKEGDNVFTRLVLTKAGTIVDLSVTMLKMVLKQFEPEGEILISDAQFLKEGTGSTASYVLHARATGAALASALVDAEGDDGTWFLALGEFELKFLNPRYAFRACLTTALTGANNDLFFCAVTAGPTGNAITIAYVVAGTSTALSIAVTSSAIVVNVATDGAGLATSTAAQIITAILASAPALSLVVPSLAAGSDGTGVVTAMAATALAGGRLGVGDEICTLSSQTFRARCERDLANNA